MLRGAKRSESEVVAPKEEEDGSCGYSPVSHRGDPGSIPCHSIWDFGGRSVTGAIF
jgi:hypothetical protein